MAQKNKRKRKIPQAVQEKDLDRFTGSSDEDENEQPSQNINEERAKLENTKSGKSVYKEEDNEDIDDDGNGNGNGNGEDVDEEIVEEDIEDDNEETGLQTSGMANVMVRILEAQTKKSSASAVLSKTITPLQRMAKEENERLKQTREKRRANRERKLKALHIPLSVATSRTTSFNESSSLVKELELERTHRRVATRGVVALFNAIAQHQKGVVDTAKLSDNKKLPQSQRVDNMSKNSFLDMIRKSASANNEELPPNISTPEPVTAKKPTWNALKENYLLDSSKNWDKQSSDDEDEKVDNNWDEDSPSERERKSTTSQKLKR